MTHNLETNFVLTEKDKNKALEGLKKELRAVDKPTVGVPDLKDEQIGQEVVAINKEYWKLARCINHEKGHATFECRFITILRQTFLAYRNYLCQVPTGPVLAERYKHKRAGLNGEGSQHGPQPSRYDRGRPVGNVGR